jgi:hypothetical protein
MKPQKGKIIIYSFVIQINCGIFNSKKDYINDFVELINHVRAYSSSYTEADWKNTGHRYNKFTIDFYQKYKLEITDEEKISKLKGVYNLILIKKEVNEFLDQIEGAIKEDKGMIEQVNAQLQNLNKEYFYC